MNDESTIDEAVEIILENEGNFSNRKEDKGGATRWGVTIGTYSKWIGRQATVDEIRTMPKETAIEIYKKNYLYGPGIHTLPSSIMTQVFDISINSGPKASIKMLQRIINLAGFGIISVDGVIGPGTRGAVERAAGEMGPYLNNALVEERLKFYNRIVERDESQRVFLKGWTHRANSFKLLVD